MPSPMPEAVTSSFEELWAGAAEVLDGPELPPDAQARRLKLWKAQEWHDWFRWRLCLAGFDWSKLIWLGTLGGGFAALIAYGVATTRWEITAGGIVAWLTVVNLGFFAYMGLRPRRPPLPIPGPFEAGQRVRARMGVYPPQFDGRKLARLWIRVERSAGREPWLFELPCPTGLPSALDELLRTQYTFRLQRGEAPEMGAVCETLPVTREQIDAGSHPLRPLAWQYDPQSVAQFKRQAY